MHILRAVCLAFALVFAVLCAGCFEEELPPAGFTISQSEVQIEVWDSVTLTVEPAQETLEWITSNGDIASVEDGVVTGEGEGEAVITASNGRTLATCRVTVLPATKEKPRKLVWSDEFNGDSLDETKWGYQTGIQDEYNGAKGPASWGNGELQYYTRDAVSVSDGALKITARREEMPEGKHYSSARILTRDNFYFTYGYIETRMKTPTGNGMWPAFWMLPQPTAAWGTNNKYDGWAANGEIDIMEAKGRLMNCVDTTLHFGGNPSTYKTKSKVLRSNTDEWHTYALDWREEYMAWIIDGEEVMRLANTEWWSNSAAAEGNPYAPFDVDFYILFDLAVGGFYDKYNGWYVEPEPSFQEAAMYIDYVRVYE